MKKFNFFTAVNQIKKSILLLFSTVAALCLPEGQLLQQQSDIMGNLKRNWYFPISAMAFFCLTLDNTLGYCAALLIVFVIVVMLSGQLPSVWELAKQHSVGRKILCAAGALGVCLGNQMHFYDRAQKLIAQLGLPEKFNQVFLLVSYLGAVCAVFFVFFCLLVFWKHMKRMLSETNVCGGINRKEWIVYGLLLLVSFGFVVFSFAQTQVFYGTELTHDIIYTSDSPALVKGNVYLALTHTENDLRQPLFAVFAAPFVGIPYFISRVIGASASVRAMLVNGVQLVMLFTANLLLAKMMKLDPLKRICFMLLSCCTYTHLLFVLMMEQYIVVYFWLIFCMYAIAEKQQPSRIALWGAGGTLLTSMILLPFMSDRSPVKNFKAWFKDMVKYALEFVVLMVVFCRFDVIFNLVSGISFLSAFTGKSVTVADKLYQYTDFICNCFAAPNAGENTTIYEHISWQLDPAAGVNLWGVLILLLAVVSAIWNRDKKSSLLAAGWVGFSAVMLFGLGWGTKENGLILYGLYFGWAFLALLFQLVEKIENKLGIRFLLPAMTACAAVGLLAVNVPAMIEMIRFAIAHYPV